MSINDELYLKLAIEVEGLDFEGDLFEDEIRNDPDLLIYHACMDFALDDTAGIKVPSHIRFESGIGAHLRKAKDTPYSLKRLDDGLYIHKDGEPQIKVHIDPPPEYYRGTTSDGASMRTVCQSRLLKYGDDIVFTAYSEECSFLQSGHDCLFCNINATASRFGEVECHKWKYPKQIAETVKAAYDIGYSHFNITGGFVPERRELEYYIDVAESIREETGLDDFNGTAVIGAPSDLGVIEQYKEAGYRTIAIHPEVWGEDFFRSICPGKAEVAGGYKQYLLAVDYALQVFGKGRVRTQFVAGLQPKAQALEGLEYFASRGAVALTIPWIPNIGSAFEGHRSPSVDWHWDLQRKNYDILKRNGVTRELLADVQPDPRLIMDFYRADEGVFPVEI